MISVYTGFPGSGKSLHAVSLIYAHVKGKSMVVTNMDLTGFENSPYFQYHDFRWFENVENVKAVASEHFHDKVKTLFVIDEAQVLFDSRNWSAAGRMDWNIFFPCIGIIVVTLFWLPRVFRILINASVPMWNINASM